MTEPFLPSHGLLQQSDERFRLLIESVRDYGIFMLDPEGRVTSWNAGAERVQGYLAHEIVGHHFSCFYPEQDRQAGKPEEELRRAIADGRVEDEGWRVRKDGTRFWANVVITALRDPASGELRGFGKVTRDLTERKRADERLRESEEQFRLLVEGVEDYAIFMLDPTGHVTTWNVGAEKNKGYRVEEIVGEYFGRFYTPEDRAAGRPEWMLNEARTKGVARDVGWRVRKDGTRFHADVLITAIHDAAGALRGFTKVTRDITEQLRTREAEAARLAAEQANQAKDDFLAVLSHELRTPLTPVLAATTYLAEHSEQIAREELVSELQSIQRNVRLEAQLIDDLLDLTRISRGKIELRCEALNLQAVLRDVVGILREEINAKQLRLTVQLNAERHWIWGDPTRVRQVFWNLLNNAVKFTPTQGAISLQTETPAAGQVAVRVTDTGIGIEPEQAERIFKAFEQGERTVTRHFGGLGLGLAITRSLVEMHHGTIDVSSAGKGHGAIFRVVLETIANPPAEAGGSVEAPARSGELRILLVDDHDDTRRILSQLLRRDGHGVDTADSAAEAIAKLRATEYQVLVSDIGLPDGSGHAVMRAGRGQWPSLCGIAVSGFGMQEDIRRSAEAGFRYHLTKPVDIAQLRELLAGLRAQAEGQA